MKKSFVINVKLSTEQNPKQPRFWLLEITDDTQDLIATTVSLCFKTHFPFGQHGSMENWKDNNRCWNEAAQRKWEQHTDQVLTKKAQLLLVMAHVRESRKSCNEQDMSNVYACRLI